MIRAIEQNNGALRLKSWIAVLPELIWLSLLSKLHGERTANRLATALSRECRQHVSNQLSPIFGAVTHFGPVSNNEWAAVCRGLRNGDVLSLLQEGLRPLVALYPRCPMGGLFTNAPQRTEKEDVTVLSTTVLHLFDRHARSTVMAEACFTWLAFDAEVLKVRSDSVLSKFPLVERYPHTELSKKIAAGIRNSNRILFGPPHYCDELSEWSAYFWNRGMEVSNCSVSEPERP
ncbi:MAG: hypothetical protein OXC31_28140 [Spirochaetaceae bacterium]|nr:hypothetical protein [Spirochaetaceae bacterium]